MTKKRIRQMNSALRRRLTGRPAADWLPQGESFARRLETEGYMQRFVPLFQGRRLRCADVLALCRPELDAAQRRSCAAAGLAGLYLRLCPPPAVSRSGTRRSPSAPEPCFSCRCCRCCSPRRTRCCRRNPAWTFRLLTEAELSGSACAVSYVQMLRLLEAGVRL